MKDSTIWPRKRLEELSKIYIKFPEKFTHKLKQESLEISKLTTKKFVAQKLNCHPSTLNKWHSMLIQYQLRQLEVTDKQGEKKIQCPVRQDKKVESTLPYIALLLPLECYLGFKGYHLSKSVFNASILESICMATLTELVPIALCHIKATSVMTAMQKIYLMLCLFASFLFSIYCVAGVEIHSLLQQISDTNKTQEIKRDLRKRIDDISKDISYYQVAVRQDGKGKGWPYRVKSLQKEKKIIQGQLDLARDQITNNRWLLWLNLLMVLILRVSWQFSSLIISSRIFRREGK